MSAYEDKVLTELRAWQRKVLKKPSVTSRLSKGIQQGVNSIIPDKFHTVMTEAIKNIVKAVLAGSEFITGYPLVAASLEEREYKVKERLKFYKNTAALEGAGTGSGGFLLGLADFPLLLSIEFKFLFDAASLYGFDVRNYKERLYILYVFQLAFSSPVKTAEVYRHIEGWKKDYNELPVDMDSFDWRTFQQEYRDYIDLAKMLQLLPGIGAVAGAYANYKLLDKLGETAVNAYRLRILDNN